MAGMVGLVAGALTLFAAVPAGATPARIPGPRCHTGNLSAAIHVVDHQAGMMKVGRMLTVTNTSTHTCVVYGYVGLGLEDAGHRLLRTRTHWGSTFFTRDPGRHVVVLSPGETASADLAWAHADAPVNVDASFLRITPPDETTYLTVPFAAPHITNGELFVTALASHTPA